MFEVLAPSFDYVLLIRTVQRQANSKLLTLYLLSDFLFEKSTAALAEYFVTRITKCFRQWSDMKHWVTYTSSLLHSVIINELMNGKILMDET